MGDGRGLRVGIVCESEITNRRTDRRISGIWRTLSSTAFGKFAYGSFGRCGSALSESAIKRLDIYNDCGYYSDAFSGRRALLNSPLYPCNARVWGATYLRIKYRAPSGATCYFDNRNRRIILSNFLYAPSRISRPNARFPGSAPSARNPLGRFGRSSKFGAPRPATLAVPEAIRASFAALRH